MKKIISSIFTSCILAAALACQVFAAAPAVTLTTEVTEAKPGDTVNITVSAGATEDLYGLQMDIIYDTAVLEYKGAQAQTPAAWYAEHTEVSKGDIRLLCYDDTEELSVPLTEAPAIYNITFQVKEDAQDGATSISVKSPLAADHNGDLLDGVTATGVTVNIRKVLLGKPVLEDLKLSNGTLQPAFDKDVKNYTATVAKDVDKIQLKAIFAEGIVVKVNDKPLTSGVNSDDITLQAGENVITVTLVRNGEENTYQIIVTREKSEETDSTDPGTDKPDTGDTTAVSVWLTLCVVAAGAICFIFHKKNKGYR